MAVYYVDDCPEELAALYKEYSELFVVHQRLLVWEVALREWKACKIERKPTPPVPLNPPNSTGDGVTFSATEFINKDDPTFDDELALRFKIKRMQQDKDDCFAAICTLLAEIEYIIDRM